MKKLLLIIAMMVMGLMFISGPVFAHTTSGNNDPKPLFSPQNQTNRFTIQLPNLIKRFTGDNPVETLFDLILTILTTLGGIVAFGYVLYGGVLYTTAGGDTGQTDKAKKMIVGAIVGIVIIAVSYVLLQYVTGTLLKGRL